MSKFISDPCGPIFRKSFKPNLSEFWEGKVYQVVVFAY